MRLESIISQIKSVEVIPDDPLIENSQFSAGSKRGKHAKKKKPSKGPKIAKKPEVNKSTPQQFLEYLNEQDLYTQDQLIQILDDYMDSFEPDKPLGDHIAHKLIESEENVIYSSMKLDILLRSIDEHYNHPTIDLYQKLLGLNGYKIPDD